MVLSQHQTSMPQTLTQTTNTRSNTHPDAKLDAARIAGMAAAMAINITALMLLLAPVSPPANPIAIKDNPVIEEWIDEVKPPPPPPPIVPITQPRTTTAPVRQPLTQPQPQTQTPTPAPVLDGTEYTPPQETTEVFPQDPLPVTNPEPQAATQLQYASAPPPAYPRDAMMDGLQGTVYLKVLVDVDGTPLSVEIQRSSGHRKLDDAARRQVLRKWKFRPAMQDGKAIQVYGIVPVDFSLTRQ
jgi:periplasmic protein TonB